MTTVSGAPNSYREPFIFISIARSGSTKIERLDLGNRIKSVIYTDEDVKLDKIEIVVENSDLMLWDEDWLQRGNLLIWSGGYPAEYIGPERFTITDTSGFEQVKITAIANTFRMSGEAKTKTWKNQSYGQIASTIATKSGIDASRIQVLDRDGTNPGTNPSNKIAVIQQRNESDARFLARIAKRAHMRFTIKSGMFIFVPYERGLEASSFVSYDYIPDGAGWIKKVDPKISIRGKKATFTTTARDPKKKKTVTATSRAGDGNTSLGGGIELVNPDTKTTITLNATGRRAYENATSQERSKIIQLATTGQTSQSKELIDKINRRLVVQKSGLKPSGVTTRRPPSSVKRLQKSADKRKSNNHSNIVKLNIMLYGDPRVRAGRIITINGLGQLLSGNYYVKKAIHRWTDGAGYETSAELKRNATSKAKKGTTTPKKTNTKKGPKSTTKAKFVPFEKVDPDTGRTKIIMVKAGSNLRK